MEENAWRCDEPFAGTRPRGKHVGKWILLLTPEEARALPAGTVVVNIFGEECLTPLDDFDTRGGYVAYGILRGAS